MNWFQWFYSVRKKVSRVFKVVKLGGESGLLNYTHYPLLHCIKS